MRVYPPPFAPTSPDFVSQESDTKSGDVGANGGGYTRICHQNR